MMMKFFATIFAFAYLLLSTGMVINIHYCSGKVKSVSIYTSADKCCKGTCTMDNKCCADKQFIVQLEPQDKTIPIPPDLTVYSNLVPEEVGIELIPLNSSEVITEFPDDLPPPKLRLWKINCSFLFYG